MDGPRAAAVVLGMLAVLSVIGAQVLRLTVINRVEPRVHSAEPIVRNFARPDLVDRNGRLLATDVAAPSLYADPASILDLDEAVERLAQALPSLDPVSLRTLLTDRTRRFVWVKRGLAPVEAQRVHDLGLPGVGFRNEPKRVYPDGPLTGNVLGHVNPDNRGLSGIERFVDDTIGLDAVTGAGPSRLVPVRLSIDLGVQHAVAEELQASLERYAAAAATGLVLDVRSGEVVAAVSLPSMDSNKPATALDPERIDRLHTGVFELGSIFKSLTVALALDEGVATLDTTYDVAQPIEMGRYRIKDHHPVAAALSVRDIFLYSSNVGAGRLALQTGIERQQAFLGKLGLTTSMRTEAGAVAPPLLPQRWGEIESVTISYGHGLAVAPIQFAAAAAALVNGGRKVTPTFVRPEGSDVREGERLLSEATSDAERQIWRLNVSSLKGTGKKADVPGMRVGGKTGTAEMPGRGGYQAKSVISSFVGALPMEAPHYLTLVSLYEPKGTPETGGAITAAHNAAPATARIVARIAPILGILPRRIAGAAAQAH